MRSPFGRARQRREQVEREARADFEAAVARAKPPTEAERTWVLPTPDVPDLGVRPPSRTPTRPQQNLLARARETREEPPTPAGEPAITPRRAPKTAKRTTATRTRRRQP